jgi:hypothetical protein
MRTRVIAWRTKQKRRPAKRDELVEPLARDQPSCKTAPIGLQPQQSLTGPLQNYSRGAISTTTTIVLRLMRVQSAPRTHVRRRSRSPPPKMKSPSALPYVAGAKRSLTAALGRRPNRKRESHDRGEKTRNRSRRLSRAPRSCGSAVSRRASAFGGARPLAVRGGTRTSRRRSRMGGAAFVSFRAQIETEKQGRQK